MRSRALGVRYSWSLRGAESFGTFVDYNQSTPGTIPEKMVYDWLLNRRVGFYYGYYFGDLPFTKDTEEHLRADFILPDYSIVIEVQGLYWHSRPGQWRRDYQRALYLAAAGYKLYTILDSDILYNINGAMSSIVELVNPAKHGGPQMSSGTRPDPSAALRARLRKWPKVVRVHWKGDAGGRRVTAFGGYHAASRAPRQYYPRDYVFTSEILDPALVAEWQKYGQEWQRYIIQLGYFFRDNERNQNKYPAEYAYWLRWRGWWNRYGRS